MPVGANTLWPEKAWKSQSSGFTDLQHRAVLGAQLQGTLFA
jgi:hypothetical protein